MLKCNWYKTKKASDLNMSITYNIEICNEKIENFSDFVGEIFEEVLEIGRTIVKEKLESLDEQLMESRDSKRYRSKGSRKTSVKTKLGIIEYNRRIYKDTDENKHVFLLDEAISAQTIGLYDKTICNNIEEMICNQSYREVAHSISETTGLDITHQAVWNIVQQMGQEQIEENQKPHSIGNIESKILYEEADGDWLNLQGEDRKNYGKSKEMKIGIAYDGVLYQKQNGGKIRRELDNKIAYASFETAKEFRKHKENVISSVYNTDEIELRVKNGDGANWIQKDNSCECICVLDKFHRNKKITECVSDKNIAENLRYFLFQNRFDELLDCIEAYINSTENERDKAKLKELYSYYLENKEALAGYYDRGQAIPPTREPGIIHHARLGSMESNVFTIIGNRMKGRRACWSIDGGNRLAALLCKHYSINVDSQTKTESDCVADNVPLSASKAPHTDGKGYEMKNASISSGMKWLKNISSYKPLTESHF